MTVSQFSEKYGVPYGRVYASMYEANIVKRWTKSSDYDEREICKAVVTYFRKRERQLLIKSMEYRNYAERVELLMPYLAEDT